MPYKTGKLKGKVTTAEIRKLIRAHNVLVTIKIPPKTDRDGLIAIIKKNGYNIDEVKGEIRGKTRPRKPNITLQQAKKITKPKEKSEQEKQQIKAKKEAKVKKIKEDKEKEKKAIKKEGVKEFKEGLKKAKAKPTPKEKPKEKKSTTISTQTDAPKKTSTISTQTKKEKEKVVKPKKKPVPADKLKFKLPSQEPKPVKIDKEKKPPKVDKSYKIIPVKRNYAIDVNLYDDIRNIPAGVVFKNLVLNRSNIFYPWRSNITASDIMFYHILRDNKSTCALPRNIRTKPFCKFKEKRMKDKDGKLVMKNTWKCRPVDRLKEWSSAIAQRFFSCYVNDDALPISISKDGNPKNTETHANLLLLNPFLMTAEHFEPHGESYRGSYLSKKKEYFKPPQSNLSGGLKAINDSLRGLWGIYKKGDPEGLIKEGTETGIKKFIQKHGDKKIPKLKYENMAETCPSKEVQAKLRGYQSGDLGRDKSPQLFDGVLITEIGGYCEMWTLFHLDLRLKTLKKTSAEVFKFMIKELDVTKFVFGGKYIELMRGMSKYAWEQIQEALTNKKYNEHGATKEDFIKYLNRDKTPNNWKVVDALTSMKVDLHDKYVIDDE